MGEYLLEVQGLKTYFKVKAGRVRAVDGVTFGVKPGEKVGVVGESGCGKSVTALSIMRLLPRPAGEIAGGGVMFEGDDLLDLFLLLLSASIRTRTSSAVACVSV